MPYFLSLKPMTNAFSAMYFWTARGIGLNLLKKKKSMGQPSIYDTTVSDIYRFIIMNKETLSE